MAAPFWHTLDGAETMFWSIKIALCCTTCACGMWYGNVCNDDIERFQEYSVYDDLN